MLFISLPLRDTCILRSSHNEMGKDYHDVDSALIQTVRVNMSTTNIRRQQCHSVLWNDIQAKLKTTYRLHLNSRSVSCQPFL